MDNEFGGYFGYAEMDEKSFRRMQLKCLDILLYFKGFCERNKLTFYLGGGSAIGAIRHHGFIPWDEDIDLFMPRPDYEKMCLLWDKQADLSRYILCRSNRKINYHEGAVCIMDVNTTCIIERNKNYDVPQGIVMDIMPLDGCANSWFARKMQLLNAMKFALYNNQRLPENKSNKIRFFSKIALALVPFKSWRDSIWIRAERKMSKYNFYGGKYITELIGAIHGMKIKHPIEDFLETVDVDFEGYKMPLMKGYDAYLKSVFGDYMQLPPENERKQKIKAVYINLDVGYEAFKGKYYCVNRGKNG